MQRSQIAAQLYSFRDFIKTPAGVRDTLHRLRGLGYVAVQLSGALMEMESAQLLEILGETGMAAPTCHYAAKDIVEDPAKVIARMKAVNCLHTAYPFPHMMPTGELETVWLAQELNRAAVKFKAEGLTLSYHNHALEFLRFNNCAMLDIIYKNAPELEAEIDTYWVHKGGGDAVRWIEAMAGRMTVLHIKDYGMARRESGSEPVMASIGSGNLDWERIFAAAKKCGVSCYVVEHDGDCPDPFASFACSMDFLTCNFIED